MVFTELEQWCLVESVGQSSTNWAFIKVPQSWLQPGCWSSLNMCLSINLWQHTFITLSFRFDHCFDSPLFFLFKSSFLDWQFISHFCHDNLQCNMSSRKKSWCYPILRPSVSIYVFLSPLILPMTLHPSSTSNHQMSAGSYCYLVFATVCLSVATYVHFIIPETKNKTFMEISRMFSKKEAVLETQGLTHGDQLKLKKMNGYGGVDHTSLEFDSSSSVP